MMRETVFVGILLFAIIISGDGSMECSKRSFNQTSFVCVCSSESCDTIDPVQVEAQGTYLLYSSDKDTNRFAFTKGTVLPASNVHKQWPNIFRKSTTTSVIINRDVIQQEILGFGGAFTDAAGINIRQLSEYMQNELLQSYFSSQGIEYNFGRVPMGGTDFSLQAYSYDDTDTPDPKLEHFALQRGDEDFKIPFMKQAKEINPDLHFLGSIWTAPKWMKTNNAYTGGAIKEEYYQVWADYFIKFLESYEKEELSFWGITTGNEPSLALVNSTINSVRWLPNEMRKWAGENLGPTIRGSKYKDLKILTLDDQRFFLPWYPEQVMSNGTEKFIDGIAVHWYWDRLVPALALRLTHKRFPDKILLSTEACRGDKFWEKAVALGDWSRAEDYAHSIIEDTNNYVQGWIDWNIALDLTGGPTYINNQVDSPIIVDAKSDQFYKQPMFYALGHFSKFIPRGSHKIDQKISNNNVEVAAFLRQDGGIVVVVLNNKNKQQNVVISDASRGNIVLNLSARSINTVLYW